jgi:hypothetical protein
MLRKEKDIIKKLKSKSNRVKLEKTLKDAGFDKTSKEEMLLRLKKMLANNFLIYFKKVLDKLTICDTVQL